MDRHEQTHPRGIGHRHRLLRRAVIADPRIVGADRHHRDVERTEAFVIREDRRQRGVAPDQDLPPFALDDVAVVATIGIALHPGAPVLHFDRTDQRLAVPCLHLRRFVPAQLSDGGVIVGRQQIGRGRGHHGCGLPADRPERRCIEMIEVRVRHQHEVDLRQFVGRKRALHHPQGTNRADADVDADAREQRRVGEDAQAVEIDQDRRMPKPGQRDRVVVPRRRRWLVWSSRQVTADLVEPLTQKPRGPRR